ncbi:hypothetical protein J3R74_001756 [Puniceicoccus vermicola]
MVCDKGADSSDFHFGQSIGERLISANLGTGLPGVQEISISNSFLAFDFSRKK